MNYVKDTFKALLEETVSDFTFSLLDTSTTKNLEFFRHVPLSIKDDRKATIFDYSARGMEHFYPWFVSEKNSVKHTDVARNLIGLLPHFEALISKKKQYPFLRCDINIFMTLMKVPALYRISVHFPFLVLCCS